MLCAEGSLEAAARDDFVRFARILEAIIHFRMHADLEALKDAYASFDPDRDTKVRSELGAFEQGAAMQRLVDRLERVLDAANYERLSEADLDRALHDESLFHLSLKVEFREFQHYVLYWRGDTTHMTKVKGLFGREREIAVPTYERVALLVQFKDESFFGKRAATLPFKPGSIVIKLFHNIPKADLEMLFPNTRVGMTVRDLLTLLVPSVAGSIGVFLKSGAAALGVFSIMWLLFKQLLQGDAPDYPEPKELAAMVGALTALGAVAGYAARQWGKYKNVKLTFMKTLADNLYFRNLDNNAGVFHHIVDSAEEEECKEALISYYFLLTSGPASAEVLDQKAEAWLRKQGVEVDFEVSDGLRKLRELGLCSEGPGGLTVLALGDALSALDKIWDNYFTYA